MLVALDFAKNPSVANCFHLCCHICFSAYSIASLSLFLLMQIPLPLLLFATAVGSTLISVFSFFWSFCSVHCFCIGFDFELVFGRGFVGCFALEGWLLFGEELEDLAPEVFHDFLLPLPLVLGWDVWVPDKAFANLALMDWSFEWTWRIFFPMTLLIRSVVRSSYSLSLLIAISTSWSVLSCTMQSLRTLRAAWSFHHWHSSSCWQKVLHVLVMKAMLTFQASQYYVSLLYLQSSCWQWFPRAPCNCRAFGLCLTGSQKVRAWGLLGLCTWFLLTD